VVDVVVAAVVAGAVVVVVTLVVIVAGTVVVTRAVVVDVATVTRFRGVSPPLASAMPIPPNPRMTSTASARMRTGVSEAFIGCLTYSGS
jgi:hypothetical protein